MARTYNTTIKDAMESVDVVTGTLPINSVEVYVLFDSGATRSFISVRFTHKNNMKLEPLQQPLDVILANTELYQVKKVYRLRDIKVGKHIFPADLVPFSLGEFDIILGIDE